MGDKGKINKKRVLGIIDKIVSMASDGEHIYRGQSDADYPHVSSTLHRAVTRSYPEDEGVNWIDMNRVQEDVLRDARRFASEDYDNKKILSHIQHYAGDTNLIDFTKDYLVALFFACNHKIDKDGKVFLLKTSNLKGGGKDSEVEMITSAHPLNRVTAQKSVFVQSRTGIISDSMMDCIKIPFALKQPILDYLRAYHGISAYSIYNDLHGYIRNSKTHEHDNSGKEFYLGLSYSYKSDKAQSLMEEDDALKKAIKQFDKAILIAPNFVVAYYNRGLAKLKSGDNEGAIRDCDKAIALNPDFVEAYGNRGNAKQGYGDAKRNLGESAISDYKDAISDYDKAIVLNPNYAEAYNNRGSVKLKSGYTADAISDLDKSIALNPDDTAAYNNRGLAKEMLGDVMGAISDYNKAIALDANYAMAYYSRGLAKGMLGDLVGAISDYDKVIALDANYAMAYYKRGVAKENLGGRQNLQQALFDFEYAKKLALRQNRQDIADLAQEAIERVTAKIEKMDKS